MHDQSHVTPHRSRQASYQRRDDVKRSPRSSPPVQPVQQETWGIIRYAPMSGLFCDEDASGFDGWYTLRGDALAIAKDWARRFPGWVIGLVSSDQIWFGNSDFSGCRDLPMTERENRFVQTSARMREGEDAMMVLRDPGG
jgi:hypothetical protein